MCWGVAIVAAIVIAGGVASPRAVAWGQDSNGSAPIDRLGADELNARFGTSVGGRRIVPANLVDMPQSPWEQAVPETPDGRIDAEALRERGVPLATKSATITRAQLAAEGFVYVNATSGSSVRRVGNCKYAFQYASEGETHAATSELGCLTRPSISVSLRPTEDGIDYRYKVTNRDGAEQSIGMVRIAVPADGIVDRTIGVDGWRTPGGGKGLQMGLPWTGWVPSGSADLAAGRALDGLTLRSSYLPGVSQASFRGIPTSIGSPMPGFPDELGRIATQLTAEEGEVRVTTLAPAIPPPPWDALEREQVRERLEADVARAATAGLVDREGAASLHSLLAKIQSSPGLQPAEVGEALDQVSALDPVCRQALELVLGGFTSNPPGSAQ